MAVINKAVTVGTSPVEISGGSINNKLVYVQNGDYAGEAEVYIGSATVTASTGLRLWRDTTSIFELNSDDALYAIASTSGVSVRVAEVTNS